MITDKKGSELKGKINVYRDFLLGLIDNKETYKSIATSIENSLSHQGP